MASEPASLGCIKTTIILYIIQQGARDYLFQLSQWEQSPPNPYYLFIYLFNYLLFIYLFCLTILLLLLLLLSSMLLFIYLISYLLLL